MLFISVPFTYNVLVPDDVGRDMSTPLFEQLSVFQSVPFHEYEHETAVPKETKGFQYIILDVDEGVRIFTTRPALRFEYVYT